MKKLLFLLWLLPAACLAQTDSTQVKLHDIYCKLYSLGGMFSKKYTEADFGQKSGSAYSLETEFSRLNKQLKDLNNEIDGLNYMATQGWESINFTEVNSSGIIFRTYLLRKRASK